MRVRGSEGAEVRVRILELSATTGKCSSSLITFLQYNKRYEDYG